MTHPLTPREKVDVRSISLAAMTEMRRSGESYEMCARWISERVHAALASSCDHAELARLAEAATPGPWIDGPPAWFRGRRSEEDGKRPIHRPGHPGTMANVYGKENAAFIAAANPATVLALLAEIAALRAEQKGK